MRKITLLISSVLVLGMGTTVFAAEQKAEESPVLEEEFLGGQPIEIEKYITSFVVGEKDFITAVEKVTGLAGTNEKYRKLAIEALKDRFFNDPKVAKEAAQDELLKLSKDGKLTLFALAALLNVGIDLNSEDDTGNTALMYAVKYGNTKKAPEIVKMLIKEGADPNKQNKSGSTALLLAVVKGYTEIAKMLTEAKGADLNIQDKVKNTALMWAVAFGRSEIAQKLIEAGADPNKQNASGYTALMWAADKGNKEIIKLLIKAKADLTMKNNTGDTALTLAEKKGHTEIVTLLEEAK